MTTSVEILNTPIPGTDYNWSETWTWEDVRAMKTWELAHDSSYSASVDETLELAEQHDKLGNKAVNETLSLQENRAFSYYLPIAEALGLSEAYVDYISFMIRVFENIGFQESRSFDSTMQINEAWSMTDKLGKKVTLSISEIVGFSEVFGRAITYRRYISEGFGVSDALAKAVTLSKSEAFGLFEQYVRKGNAIISDMLLSDGDLTLSEFKDLMNAGKAPGFAPFTEFVQGDYDYQYAIFRAVMKSVTDDRAVLTNLKIDVDVPDVTDRGFVEVPTAGIRVNFNRVFHMVPEVICTTTGGTEVAVPRVTDKDETGFTVSLKGTDNLNKLGTISWSAHGY